MVLEMTKCEDMNVIFGVSSPEHALLFYFYFKAIRVLYKKKRITVLEIVSHGRLPIHVLVCRVCRAKQNVLNQ